jgi:hypothetical protein
MFQTRRPKARVAARGLVKMREVAGAIVQKLVEASTSSRILASPTYIPPLLPTTLSPAHTYNNLVSTTTSRLHDFRLFSNYLFDTPTFSFDI